MNEDQRAEYRELMRRKIASGEVVVNETQPRRRHYDTDQERERARREQAAVRMQRMRDRRRGREMP